MNEKRLLPLLIDMQGREVVVFGGGKVGERKALIFSKYCKTTVISKEFTEKLLTAQNSCGKGGFLYLRHVSGPLSDSDISMCLAHAFIAVTATSDTELNDRITYIAHSMGVAVNEVNGVGDVVIPSIIERGDIHICISTLGKSPALSKYTRMQIESVITPAYAQMSRLQAEMRDVLKQNVSDQAKRAEILWEILDDKAIWDAVTVSYDDAYKKAYKNAQKYIDNNIDNI